jgi:hypothetical protein
MLDAGSTSEPAHRILIRPEAWGSNIDVVIDPPLPGGESFDRDFPTLREARGYAGGIRMTRGYPVVDMAEPSE